MARYKQAKTGPPATVYPRAIYPDKEVDNTMPFKLPASSPASSVDVMGNSICEYVVAADALVSGGNLLTKLGGYDKHGLGAMRSSVGSLGMYIIRELEMSMNV